MHLSIAAPATPPTAASELRRLPLVAALVTLIVHLVGNPHYGFYGDELYFIICGFRPDWGYADQPPLVPLVSAGTQVLGHSLIALRALPALFAAASVYVTCLFVIEIGGGAFAQVLGATVTACMPVLAAFGTKVSTDMPGLVLWPLMALLVARIANGGDPRLWLATGAVFGVAANAKYSVFFYGTALIGGVAVTGLRRILATPWLLAGAAAGALVALPSLIWQAIHGFPVLEMLSNQQRDVIAIHSPQGAIAQQVLITNPLLAPIWIVGLVYAFLTPGLRWIGWTYVLFEAAMIALHGRHYYSGDVYPIVIAVGALAVERTVHLRAARACILAFVTVAAIMTVPFVLPVLPESRLAGMIAALKGATPVTVAAERHADAALTDNFAGMHGWGELVAAVAGVYRSLPARQRAHAAILTKNFSEAAAIDFYGRTYGLPRALSGNNNYWIWGSRGYDGKVIVEVNLTCGPMFRSGRAAVARVHNPWALLSEQDIPISVCYGLREPLATYWPRLKTYI
jgi:4-amino-4-deoxy-L-arabinose transferase-like glycosyltransferase